MDSQQSFIAQLKAAGAVTSGNNYLSQAWHSAKELVGDAVEAVKYAAGFIVGLLEGAWGAVVDLFKGAADMIEAVAKVLYSLITRNPGRIKDMLMGWVEKMKTAWENRAEIADEFLKKWNASSGWDRGRFQGEVLGWVMMTVLIIVITAGSSSAAQAGSFAARWPQVVKLLKTVDAIGDVTTYVGSAVKALKLPARAVDLVKGKLGKGGRIVDDVIDAEQGAAHGANRLESAGRKPKLSSDGCFVAGTPVRTQGGTRFIETLRLGARVIATDDQIRGSSQHAVLQTFRYRVELVVDIFVSSAKITVTPNHPFWVDGKGWCAAGTLRPGDQLVSDEGELLAVDTVLERAGDFDVYNITVEGLATYHVSHLGVRVHNKPAKLDHKGIFDGRKVELYESIKELRNRIEKLKKTASTKAHKDALDQLERDVNALEREVNATTYAPLPSGADPATHYDNLARPEQLETKALKDAEELEKQTKASKAIPSSRPALDSETVLADGSGAYARTGKSYHGRSIYRGPDGKLYYVDNLHTGSASEIEVFSSTGEHLGTMTPDGKFKPEGRVKGRRLPKDKL